MYRVFALSEDGWLYQLTKRGWKLNDGSNFQNVRQVWNILNKCGLPELPGNKAIQDSFIASVDSDGTIQATFPLMPKVVK